MKTYCIFWVDHGVKWTNSSGVFVQDEEVSLVLLLDQTTKLSLLGSAMKRKEKLTIITLLSFKKSIYLKSSVSPISWPAARRRAIPSTKSRRRVGVRYWRGSKGNCCPTISNSLANLLFNPSKIPTNNLSITSKTYMMYI